MCLHAFTLLSGLSLWLSLCRVQAQTVGPHLLAKVHSLENVDVTFLSVRPPLRIK